MRSIALGAQPSPLHVLMGAALSIPCAGLARSAMAEGGPPSSEIRFQYYQYEDWQSGDRDRMKIKSPIAWFKTVPAEDYEVEGSFVLDTMSGASPLFLDTLSGASGEGVEDIRRAEDVRVTRTFESFNISAGAEYSEEDDYRSVGGTVESRVWSKDRNTTFAFGFSGSQDDITSTNDAALDENRTNLGGLFGVTQVINQNSILQSNLTYKGGDGYHTDPYKLYDLRPLDRNEWAWLTRWNYYISSLKSSVHTDYRYFRDSWGIISHTLEVAYYQPVSEHWIVRPHFRYYTQSKADFFSSTYPPENPGDDLYTTDHRLGGFGGISTGLKFIVELPDEFTAQAQATFITEQPDWKLGSEGSAGISDFYAGFFGIGLSKRW